MADRHKSHPQAPLYGPGGASSTSILTQLKQFESALSIGWSQLTSVPTTISGYGITDAYTDAEVDALLLGKADVGDSYTKAEADALLAVKADSATTLAGYGITDAYTETEVDTAIDNSQPIYLLEVTRSTSDQALTSGTNTTLLFNNVLTDTASGFNTTTGQYTVPATGLYLIIASLFVKWASGSVASLGSLEVNGSTHGSIGCVPYLPTFASGSGVAVVNLTVGDLVRVRMNAGGTNPVLASGGLSHLFVVRLNP